MLLTAKAMKMVITGRKIKSKWRKCVTKYGKAVKNWSKKTSMSLMNGCIKTEVKNKLGRKRNALNHHGPIPKHS